MTDIAAYLAEIEVAFINSPAVVEYQVVRSWDHGDDGYIRVRATLSNGDFLEAAEYAALEQDRIQTIDYRHHWSDGSRKLRQRWDSTPHHPELANFPHHVHLGNEDTLSPSQAISIVQVLRILEIEIANSATE